MKQDRKLIAFKQSYEVKDICRLFQILKADFLKRVKVLPHRHSRKEVEALLLGAGFTKHLRKK